MIHTMSDSLRDHLVRASQRQKEKYKTEDFSTWGKLSVQKRTAGMTDEEKSEYFRKIRKGEKVNG